MQVTVTAESISLHGKPLALHWVLSALPTPDDVKISDPGVKADFIAAMGAKLPKVDAECPKLIMDRDATGLCSFTTDLNGGPDQFDLLEPAEMIKAPPGDATPINQPATFTVRGNWKKAQLPPMQTLCIGVTIGIYGAFSDVGSVCKAQDTAVVEAKLGDLADANGLGPLPLIYAQIKIRTWAKAGPPNIITQLQSIAVQGYLSAKKEGMLPGETPPAHQSSLFADIQKIYNIDDSGWPDVKQTFGRLTADGGDYFYIIQNLRTVSTATVMLTDAAQMAKPTPEQQVKLDAKLRDYGCALQEGFNARLDAMKDTIPTNDGAWKLAVNIGKSDTVTGVVIPKLANGAYTLCQDGRPKAESSADNRIAFTAAFRWVIGSLDATANAGLSASPHEIISGTAQIGESQLLLPNAQTFADTASLTVNGGPAVQRADFAFGIGRTSRASQPIVYGLELSGVYFRDQNQRFGYLAGPKFVDEEYGAEPGAYIEFTRPAETYAFTAHFRADAGFQFRHVGVQSPATYPPFLNHGWVNGLAPSFSALAGYDFAHETSGAAAHGGIGQALVSIDGNFLRSRKEAGGDFDFDRYSVHGEAEVFFGATSSNDFVVRYGRGFSASSAVTPLFEMPQLGGDANLRGIEIGEYVGRGFGFDQTEIGVNAASVWNWFYKKQPTPVMAAVQAVTAGNGAAVPENKGALSSLGIDSIFVLGLYDRARVENSSAPGSLLDLRHGFHGSGVEVEIRGLRVNNRKANIGLIYARSPDSVIHRRGVFITSVSLDF